MKFLRRILNRLKRQTRAANQHTDPTMLREFVYLDEVSVYSLLSSRYGALPSEYTHSDTYTMTDSWSSTAGVNIHGITVQESNSPSRSRSQSVQILRKSSVQAAFKDLYFWEKSRFAVGPEQYSKDDQPQALEGASNSGIESLRKFGIKSCDLIRGALVEFEVELQAERIYRFASIISTMQAIASEGHGFYSSELYENIGDIDSVNKILTRLLVGLIPIKCRAVDYQAVTLNDEDLIIHKRFLRLLPQDIDAHCRDLYVAGVTEESLYWKDVRRVLFSGSRYRVLCRLNCDGIQESWNPVKLVNVLSDVAPDLAKQVEQLNERLGSPEIFKSQVDNVDDWLQPALMTFSVSLAEECGVTIHWDELPLICAIPPSTSGYQSRVEVHREAFLRVTETLSGRYGIRPDDDIVLRLRDAAINTWRPAESGGREVRKQPTVTSNANENGAIIDAEVIAVYW